MFKTCTNCGAGWRDLDEFLDDPGIDLVGYQIGSVDLAAGIFFFNHSCLTTLALPVGEFRSLHDGPVYEERRTGSEECPGYCLRRDEPGPCPVACECAYVRDIMQRIRERSSATG